MIRYRSVILLAMMVTSLAMTGCNNNTNAPQAGAQKEQPKLDEVAEERAKLTPTYRALVEAQEWCVVSNDERLGAMGPPLKLDIKGQPVFVCCKGCKKKAEADPDGTLAKAENLKAKAKTEREAKK
jgi:hypothetical protein